MTDPAAFIANVNAEMDANFAQAGPARRRGTTSTPARSTSTTASTAPGCARPGSLTSD